jgi:hypothetical protein
MTSILDYRRDVAVRPRLRIAWTTEVDELLLVEPTLEEVAAHAAELATAYNDPANARLMGHDEVLASEDVVEHYRGIRDSGGTPFLLYLDGILVGDADLRVFATGRPSLPSSSPRTVGRKGSGARLADGARVRLHRARPGEGLRLHRPGESRVAPGTGRSATGPESGGAFLRGRAGRSDLILDRAPFLGSHAEVIARLRFGV